MFNLKSCPIKIFEVNHVKEKNDFGIKTVVSSSLVDLSLNNHLPQLVFNIQKNNLHQNSNQGHFLRGCVFCSHNLLAERNHFGLINVIIQSSVSKEQKNNFTETRACVLCRCNILDERNDVGLIHVLLPSLVTKVPGFEPTQFWSL
jgi:hypothetical protein